jgi:type VI secretion system protein ImpK
MTLLEVCEPIFQYICRISRGARKGAAPELAQAQSEVQSVFRDAKARASAGGLSAQFDKVELVLMGFCDWMIRSSRLSWASRWPELAHQRRELGMDEKFFDLLDETLRDPSPEATERLTVFYTCLGLGFMGWYSGQPQELRKKMSEIASRIGSRMDADRAARICPEAYDSVDKRALYQPPTRTITTIGIILVGLALTAILANIGLFKDRRDALKQSVDAIIASDIKPALTTREAR